MCDEEAVPWFMTLKTLLIQDEPTVVEEDLNFEEVEYWRQVGDSAIEVNLKTPISCGDTYGSVINEPDHGDLEWVRVERISDDLFIGGRKVGAQMSFSQLGEAEGGMKTDLLRRVLVSSDTVDPRFLDAILEFEDGKLFPELWKMKSGGKRVYLYFWDVIFKNRFGTEFVRVVSWSEAEGRWMTGEDFLDAGDFGANRRALVLLPARGRSD
jgi:hypothetical protein